MLKNFVSSFLSTLVQYACAIYCIDEYVGGIVLCTGPSMEPTLYNDDVLLTERISVRCQKIKKGDIVIAKCPINPNQHICKRVVGLPGDQITPGCTVPSGHLWLEGDNFRNSTDSRIYGPVPQGLLRARVICTVFPFKDITKSLKKHEDGLIFMQK